jgi:hypothetical protein
MKKKEPAKKMNKREMTYPPDLAGHIKERLRRG